MCAAVFCSSPLSAPEDIEGLLGVVFAAVKILTSMPYFSDGTRCASACATWLGGSQRFMGQTAQIGFHAAYVSAGGQVTETGAGNAMLGAYLNELGISERAILYITSANPHSMTWLSLADAEEQRLPNCVGG